MNKEKTYIAIDLKSFYASVECRERGLDPMTTNLVVADESRTEKTICLAVSPSLKSYGIPGRARLFEAIQKVKEANNKRKWNAPNRKLTGESYSSIELKENPALAISYITAPPRMALYMEYSTIIYNIYLKYVSAEDIHVYSIDEVFMDVTDYLATYKCTAHELTKKIIRDVLANTGITATAGIGTNMYLCKVAMDIMAKRTQADKDGVRIAELDEMSYRRQLWNHKPLTDFWRVGKGYASKLEANRMYTMGDVARCSIDNEDLLYKLFGINAELLIDHAWGWEPCTISEVKKYKPQANSISSGQVLSYPYTCDKARLIVHEMIDLLVLDLVDKNLVTDQIVLDVGYDIENLTNPKIRETYSGEITVDHYGREVPKHAHGTINLKRRCSSTKLITEATLELFDKIVNKNLLIRRLNVTACKILSEDEIREEKGKVMQMDLFTDYEALEEEKRKEDEYLDKEKKRQRAVLDMQKKYGKNAVLKGMNYQDGATTKERNEQIGGHKA